MSILDVFNDDAFSMQELSLSLEAAPYIPGRIGELGLFQEEGISTPIVAIEEKRGQLSLIPVAARGTMPTFQAGDLRDLRTFVVPHLPLNDAVMASEVEGVRQFGSEDAVETIAAKVAEKNARLRQSHENTWEYHRIGAVQGLIKDADGSTTLLNLFTAFDVTETNVNFDFSTDDVKVKILDIEHAVEDVLNGLPYTGIQAICGNEFFADLVTSDEVKDTFATWQENKTNFGPEARTPRTGFVYGGITWWNYRGKIGSVDFIPTAQARFFPEGVPDLFIRRNAPAPFMETVNTIGKPLYMKSERMKWDIGQELHSNSNPLHLCTRPGVLIKGTNTTP